MNINDRLAFTIGRLVMQNEANAEQIEALQKQVATAESQTIPLRARRAAKTDSDQ